MLKFNHPVADILFLSFDYRGRESSTMITNIWCDNKNHRLWSPCPMCKLNTTYATIREFHTFQQTLVRDARNKLTNDCLAKIGSFISGYDNTLEQQYRSLKDSAGYRGPFNFNKWTHCLPDLSRIQTDLFQ